MTRKEIEIDYQFILKKIKRNPKITNKQIGTALEIPLRTVKLRIKEMISLGMIVSETKFVHQKATKKKSRGIREERTIKILLAEGKENNKTLKKGEISGGQLLSKKSSKKSSKNIHNTLIINQLCKTAESKNTDKSCPVSSIEEEIEEKTVKEENSRQQREKVLGSEDQRNFKQDIINIDLEIMNTQEKLTLSNEETIQNEFLLAIENHEQETKKLNRKNSIRAIAIALDESCSFDKEGQVTRPVFGNSFRRFDEDLYEV